MTRRPFFSSPSLLIPLLIFMISVMLPALVRPASAAGISLLFDSEGRQLRSLPKATEKSTRRSSHNSAPEGVSPLSDVAYEYYPVSGRTFSEIMRSIGENGPYIRNRTERQPCRVDWTVEFSLQYEFSSALDEENGKMHAATEISGITLEDNSTVTLPSLIDDTALNPVEQSMWRTYLSDLVAHCHNVVAIIRDQQVKKTAGDKLTETTYLIFDYTEGMDVEKSVDSFLRGEAIRTAIESVREISALIAEYQRTTSPGGHQKKSGTGITGPEK